MTRSRFGLVWRSRVTKGFDQMRQIIDDELRWQGGLLELGARGDAGQDAGCLQAERDRARDVGVVAITDHQGLGGSDSESSHGLLVHPRVRLADDVPQPR